MKLNLKNSIIAAVLSIAAVLILWAFVFEPSTLTIRRLTFQKWPGPALKIAFFADLHAGSPFINREYIHALTQKINSENPDIILIGGDFLINEVIGGTHLPMTEVMQELQNLKAPLGVYAVLGNHDWWNDGIRTRTALESSGIKVIENEALIISTIPTDASGFSFWLVGVGDDYTEHANPKLAFEKVPAGAPSILLLHDPGSMNDVGHDYFVALAGHTHGGQVKLPFYGALITPTRAPTEWANGKIINLAHGPLFVTNGIGTSILPVRFLAPPEYVILNLVK